MKREAEQGILPDPELDAFMKVSRLLASHADMARVREGGRPF